MRTSPPNNAAGRNQTGNVYEALVGLYWLEGQTHALVDLFLTLMDLDQIEYAQWSTSDKKSSTGSLRGPHALKCSRFAFVPAGRSYGYANGCPSPATGAVAEPREWWIQDPGAPLWIPESVDDYVGGMPKGNPLPPPPPKDPAPAGGSPRNTANPGGAPSSSNDHGGWRGAGVPAPGGTQDEAARSSGGHAQQGTTPVQGQRRPQAYPRPLDIRDKYLISFIEGHEAPQPRPGKDTVIFKITMDGTQEFESYYPLTRKIVGNRIVETF